MNNASLELGGTNWAEKDGNILGYSVGDTSGKYFPQEFTFSRGSNLSATRINKAGLIVKGRENVVLQSNQFDTTWITPDATITGGQADKDGGTNAWLLTKTQDWSRVEQTISKSGVWTFSVYAKAGTSNWLALENGGVSSDTCYFNLSGGTKGSVGSGALTTSIESVGNEWYRCSVTINGTSTIQRIYVAASNGNINGSNGSVYIQSAQLEQGLVATPYIETTSTTAEAGVLENTPRLNYTTGVANPYLLLEPSRTNIFAYSEGMFDSSYFHQILTISVEGQQTDLNGTNTAVKLSNFVQSYSRLDYNTTVVAVDGKTYTYSAYYKGSGSININVSTSTGVGGAAEKTITLTDEWVRHSVTATFSSPTGNVKSHLAITRTPNNDAEVYLCFAQIEEGFFSTSYIPTYGTSATRAADTCSKTDASGVIGQTEGTMFIDSNLTDVNSSTLRGIMELNDGGTFSRITLFRNLNGTIRLFVRNGGATQMDETFATPPSGATKIAIGYALNDIVLYVNGLLVVSDTSATIPACTDLDIGHIEGDLTKVLGDSVNQAALYKERLTNAELATLTTL